MARVVEACPFRVCVRRQGGNELAECRLLQRMTATGGPSFPVRRDACEHCSRLAAPTVERPNSVVASLLFDAAQGTIGADGASGIAIRRALRMQQSVMQPLELVRPSSDCGAWGGCAPRALAPGRLIDRKVTVDSLTGHLKRREPFSFLRYGDGEWLSMLGAVGKTTAGHDFFPETAGREMRKSLDYVAGLFPHNRSMYVGLSAGPYGLPVQAYLKSRGLTDAVHWVDSVLFQQGLRDLSTRRLLEAVGSFRGPKYLVANGRLGPIARGLRCTHLTIPERNCYLAVGATERGCRFRGKGIVLLCASFASECLIARWHRRNPLGTYVDCGHIFDAIVWRRTRRYTRRNVDGIVDFLKEHYGPMFVEGNPV